jgi:nitrate reductase NapAB chaperone NapD
VLWYYAQQCSLVLQGDPKDIEIVKSKLILIANKQVNIAIVPVVVAHLLQLHHQLISMANGRHLFFILFSEHFVIFYAINH